MTRWVMPQPIYSKNYSQKGDAVSETIEIFLAKKVKKEKKREEKYIYVLIFKYSYNFSHRV